MTKIKFPFYGALIGALFAIFASFGFGAVAALIILSRADIRSLLFGFGFAVIYSVMFSAIPGAVGGAYLARWLEKAERTPRDVTFHGLLIGGLAGLVAVLAFVAILLRFWVDWMTAVFALLAIAVASVCSLLAARWLAWKKPKFVKPPE